MIVLSSLISIPLLTINLIRVHEISCFIPSRASVFKDNNEAWVSGKYMSSPNKVSNDLKRVARRDLKKRITKRTRDGNYNGIRENEDRSALDNQVWLASEKRPLIRSRSIESGLDYWIDDRDLQLSLQREQAIKNRKALEGEIPKEKLRSEVVAPYKQNWIGYLSVVFIILATIISQFPELLQAPIIPLPDLLFIDPRANL